MLSRLPVCYPAKGDFLVDGKYLFEVGGADKTFEQIKDIPNSFLAIDNTETGYKNRIPLWLFGMLYLFDIISKFTIYFYSALCSAV